jgi:hypothetical protein
MKSWTAPILCLSLILAGAAAQAQTIKPFGKIKAAGSPDSLSEPATTPPLAPTRLQALAASADTLLLIWQDNANNESGYRVEGRAGTDPYVEIGVVPANREGAVIGGLDPGITYSFRVRATNDQGNSAYSNEASDTTLASNQPCTATSTAMCLNNNRFLVQALYLTSQNLNGDAKTVKLTDDSGYLWFFAASNIEAVVKVLNGCTTTGFYWVFAGGLTDVRVVLAVTDTQTGEVAAYSNDLGDPFQPIQDTQALDSCPQ